MKKQPGDSIDTLFFHSGCTEPTLTGNYFEQTYQQVTCHHLLWGQHIYEPLPWGYQVFFSFWAASLAGKVTTRTDARDPFNIP